MKTDTGYEFEFIREEDGEPWRMKEWRGANAVFASGRIETINAVMVGIMTKWPRQEAISLEALDELYPHEWAEVRDECLAALGRCFQAEYRPKAT